MRSNALRIWKNRKMRIKKPLTLQPPKNCPFLAKTFFTSLRCVNVIKAAASFVLRVILMPLTRIGLSHSFRLFCLIEVGKPLNVNDRLVSPISIYQFQIVASALFHSVWILNYPHVLPLLIFHSNLLTRRIGNIRNMSWHFRLPLRILLSLLQKSFPLLPSPF